MNCARGVILDNHMFADAMETDHPPHTRPGLAEAGDGRSHPLML